MGALGPNDVGAQGQDMDRCKGHRYEPVHQAVLSWHLSPLAGYPEPRSLRVSEHGQAQASYWSGTLAYDHVMRHLRAFFQLAFRGGFGSLVAWTRAAIGWKQAGERGFVECWSADALRRLTGEPADLKQDRFVDPRTQQ
jgi:hypothetical protein